MGFIGFNHKIIKTYLSIYATTFVLLFKDVIPFMQNPSIQAVLLGIILMFNISQDKTGWKGCLWYSIFAFVSAISFIAADEYAPVSTLLNTLLYIVILSILCKGKEQVNHFFISVSMFGGILFTYILIKYFSILGYGRLGDYMDGTSYGNSIQFSYYILSILCSSFIVANNEDTKKVLKFFASIFIVLGFIIAVFNGAKKGYIIPLFFIMLYTFLKNKSNALKLFVRYILLIAIIALVWNSIRNIELLQRYFVNRVESMFLAFADGSAADDDGSTSTRVSYIPVAINSFADSPVWGMGGLGFSRAYFIDIIRVSHPHNNFLNLLAAGGLVLFSIYYWFPFHILKSCYSIAYKNKNTILMLTLIITILFNDLNSSTYNIPIINIFYVVAYKYLVVNKYYGKNSFCCR